MGKAKRKSRESADDYLTPFLAPLQGLQNLLSEFHERGAIIGGIAATLLGAPRFTADIDAVLLISLSDIPSVIQTAAKQGIETRIPEAETFARKNRVLLLRHVASGTDIDLSLGMLPFEIEMVERSKVYRLGTIDLRLPTPEDLIILKAVANREKDLSDIRAIALSHPDIDKERIRYWAEQFGEALNTPNLWANLEKLL